ncbi:MAG: hypothetical protein NTX61_05255 [Bacteroidetes bacterium]|nr:hypothetical protein [Bacteroidota bacterium]
MDDEVLTYAFRGHTASDTETASKMIKERGFSLGLQMMIGLPGDSEETDLMTVEKFIEMDVDFVRVYPVLVIRDTSLETLFNAGKYRPLTLEEAIHRAKTVLLAFEEHDIPVIRMGLHPSDGLLDHSELVVGPFHPSFRELVMTSIWHDRIMHAINDQKSGNIIITVNPLELNHAVGYYGQNKKALQKRFEKVGFKSDPSIEVRKIHVDHC